jgi:hypothetical protein
MSQLPPFDPTHVLQYTQSPNPDWKFGRKLEESSMGAAWLEGDKQGWTVVDAESESPL